VQQWTSIVLVQPRHVIVALSGLARGIRGEQARCDNAARWRTHPATREVSFNWLLISNLHVVHSVTLAQHHTGCFIGCPTCDDKSGRRQVDLCGEYDSSVWVWMRSIKRIRSVSGGWVVVTGWLGGRGGNHRYQTQGSLTGTT
jgi:hypothetical protein